MKQRGQAQLCVVVVTPAPRAREELVGGVRERLRQRGKREMRRAQPGHQAQARVDAIDVTKIGLPAPKEATKKAKKKKTR